MTTESAPAQVQLSPVIVNVQTLGLDDLPACIIDANRGAEQLRDMAIGAGRLALERAIYCGTLIARARDLAELHGRGQFTAWLELQVESHDDFPSIATCWRYLKATRYKETLGNGCPDFASIQELYIAAGILPPKESADSEGGSNSSRREAPMFRLKFELAAPNPAQWQSIDRREFLQKAKPVVDLYEACKAAEAES